MDCIKVEFGGIVIQLSSAKAATKFRLKKAHSFFKSRKKPHTELQVYFGDLPDFKVKELVLETGSAWSLYQVNGRYIFKTPSDSSPERLVLLDSDFKKGKIHINPKGLSAECLDYPLWYPLDEFLIVNILSKGKGLLAHSCGISINGRKRGLLFVGKSGSGKSTLANLCKAQKNATILSDDRIIIRKRRRGFWIYGTPWHGDAKVCSPEKVPLEKIFFLKHAEKNSVKKIERLEDISRLIVCSFPTFWDKKGMEFTLSFSAELAQKVPCYELGFVNNESILPFIKDKV